MILRENGLQRPAKGGSTPAFACQRAAIAPLPCLNLQLVSQRQSNCELASFKKCNCSRKNRLQNQICFANVGCSPTPRQHFCKIAGAKNFLFACGSIFGNDASKENGLSHPAKGGSTPAFAYQCAAIAPETLFSHYNLLILKAIAILSILS